jgi:hypothetical protein
LIKFMENLNLCNLYNKAGCHVVRVLKVIWISKNTAIIDMLLLKFKVAWSINFTLQSCAVLCRETKLTCNKQVSHLNTLRTGNLNI